MKKLLALLLALACLFSFAACNSNNNNGDGGNTDGGNTDGGNTDGGNTDGGNTDGGNTDGGNSGDENVDYAHLFELYSGYLAASAPTKSDVTSTTSVSDNTLVYTAVLTTGKVDGKAASKLVTSSQTFNTIESGMLNLINEKNTEEWYLEGKGTTDSKGRRWNADGKNFAPVAGNALYLNLSSLDNFTSMSYNKEKGELVLVCSEDTAANVIGYYLPSSYSHVYETTITITAFGGRITGIKISYAIDERPVGTGISSSIFVDYTTVEINAVYSYGLQAISFE